MKLKKEFLIKGNVWALKYKWGLKADGVMVDGLTDQTTRTIYIDQSLKGEDKLIVFLHEFIHASLLEIHLSGPSDILTSDVEEIIATGLSEIISSTFDLKWKRKE